MKIDATTKRLIALQRDEATLCEVYRRLSESGPDCERNRLLRRLMDDERRHVRELEQLTGLCVGADGRRVRAYRVMARLLGVAFVMGQMTLCERCSEKSYARYSDTPLLAALARDERRHHRELTAFVMGMPLSYISSVVLGLNDALVEFTGALAGFTLALHDSRLVALTGGVTGIAAALSMAASEYLSTKTGRSEGKRPLKAALCTGSAYVVTVSVLLLPFLFFSDAFFALCVMLVAALAVIASFNYYYAVVRCENFRRRFLEMSVLSFSIAGISFLAGYLLRRFSGIEG